jgi:hypothetical protein
MKLHHQITGSHLEGQAKSSSFEREIKKPPHEAMRAFYSVPGTRHVDSAKSIDDEIHFWWILREMPLDPQRPRRKSIEKGNVTLT